jgi:hypothetical protein
MDLMRRLVRLGAPKFEIFAEMSDVLGTLRERVALILCRRGPEPRAPADPSGGLLPFFRETTTTGELYRRSLSLAPSHAVGRIPLHSARAASPELLALLALDPRLAGVRPERH